MGTKGIFAKQIGSNEYKCVHFLYEGYTKGMGEIIFKYYKKEEKIDTILNCGYGELAVLEKDVEETIERHKKTFGDRNSFGVSIYTEDELKKHYGFVYIYTLNKEWVVFDNTNKKTTPLSLEIRRNKIAVYGRFSFFASYSLEGKRRLLETHFNGREDVFENFLRGEVVKGQFPTTNYCMQKLKTIKGKCGDYYLVVSKPLFNKKEVPNYIHKNNFDYKISNEDFARNPNVMTESELVGMDLEFIESIVGKDMDSQEVEDSIREMKGHLFEDNYRLKYVDKNI